MKEFIKPEIEIIEIENDEIILCSQEGYGPEDTPVIVFTLSVDEALKNPKIDSAKLQDSIKNYHADSKLPLCVNFEHVVRK